jgi:diguanylate cyclase (GGDEF)-like protein/PAS domain S-box-containing protein
MSEDAGPDIITSLHTDWTTTVDDSRESLQRKLAEQRLRTEQLTLLGSAIRVAGQGIAILTPAVESTGPRIAFVNDGFCTIYGRKREEVIGETLQIFGVVDRHASILTAMLHHIFEGRQFNGEATVLHADGGELEVELDVVPVADAGQVTHWVAFVRDVTEARSQVVQLRHQAMHDALTGLPNRAMLFDRVDAAIADAKAKGMSLALLLMDLDRFKEVNDTFGHHFGDVLLRHVAYRIQNQLSNDEIVARLGGDEFAVLLPTASDASNVAGLSRRILNTLEQPFIVEGQVLEVGASIGIAMFPEHGDDARTLLRRADGAMYSAKQAQSGYVFHKGEQESRSPDHLALVVEMRNALTNGEFELYFQPKLHLRSGLVTRAEVLIRWNHPTRGLLPPSLFVPIAERTGIIRSITDWLLDKALEQCRAWQDAGVPLHLAVNISAKSLLEQTLPSKINALLEKWNVDPRFLKIEITESSIMADPAHALAIMSMLQSLGVRLSVDDFGTGYSSFTHLRQLPIDEIKIDKSFVAGMTTSDADVAIVRTVVDLAHHLGKQVCAEGVEDEATWKMLHEIGCDLAQGYWISHPLSSGELADWLVKSCWGLNFRALTKWNRRAETTESWME